MKKLIQESDLPLDLNVSDAVEAAYSSELATVEASLLSGLSTLIESDKEISSYFYRQLRNRLKKRNIECVYFDGRPSNDDASAIAAVSNPIIMMIQQIRDTVRGPVEKKLIVLPHLDLLVTSSGTLTSEAKEIISLMYENPQILWLGFKDPSFSLPSVILNLFPRQESIIGISRDRLKHLITQVESKKFGVDFDAIKLYKYVSGVNAVKLRKLLSTINGEDYPSDPTHAYKQLRSSTLTGQLTIPDINLHKDIGGYSDVKEKIQNEILDMLAAKDDMDEADAKEIESIIPRGMIFWGPPGTGKTLFAKAIATALNATCIVVSGPELKSKWVGESEENLRRIFTQARKSAPAVIVFDEIDSFAHARGTYSGSGVEHSMVNQLLTEMDGFRKEELVFIIGTTNFVESLDPALLRPGRFEFHLEIPYPNNADRQAIIEIYNKKMNLKMSNELVDYAVNMTDGTTPDSGTRYSGDHLNAFARQLKRTRLRLRKSDDTTKAEIDEALLSKVNKINFTKDEEKIIALHEAGHAIVAMDCKHIPPIDKISIGGEGIPGALGFVKYTNPANKYVVTKKQLEDIICTLMGGREAEILHMDGDISIGSQSDITRATEIARSLVEDYGFSQFKGVSLKNKEHISESTKMIIDQSIDKVIQEQSKRANAILKKNQASLLCLKELLIEKKTIDRATFREHIEKVSK